MKTIKRLLVAVTCLFAAIACYVFGIPAGGALFLILGLLLEGLFWHQLLRRRKAD
ncbi:hypothetical protein [Microbulbifer sp. ALW1]|uniref:hypothetical protein n=1 Tax=Microbulbifer sp. (strain ALW1) TaxID=1516059 RepID=UPI0019145355|nr:hypothetical protein [Microbulbifer sp. ALW1]